MDGKNVFELYNDKNSLSKKNTRMLNGGETNIKGDKLGWWERKPLEKDPATDRVIRITNSYEKRPDLVSFDYLGTTQLTWLVLQYNNIVDINEEFILGKEILLPQTDRARTELAGENPTMGLFLNE